MKNLKNEEKVCVLTGAAGVLCSSIAEDLLHHGAKVALLGRTKSKLDDLAKRLASKGLKQTIVCEADVLDVNSLKKAEQYEGCQIYLGLAKGDSPEREAVYIPMGKLIVE